MARLSRAVLAFLLAGGSVVPVESKATYIVQMAPQSAGSTGSLGSLVSASLQAVVPGLVGNRFYDFKFLGAVAVSLSADEVHTLRSHPEVLGVFPDKKVKLHTTRTPEFLGLNDAALFGSPASSQSQGNQSAEIDTSDIVIGVFDTGAWPESESYKDAGLPPVPARWKGQCVTGDGWTAANCNKKLIGARYFYKGVEEALKGDNQTFTAKKSARDVEGHGTHTSSTAAGSPVHNASSFGLAQGTARGMAPQARLAIYRVCWPDGCFTSDIVAAIEAAIQDGVDVMSMSIGGDQFTVAEPISKMTLEALRHGIFVSMSAGNSGADPGTVSNLQPWALTVGASTLDREFPATATLGNGAKLSGQTGYSVTSLPDSKPLPKTPVPFISGAQAAINASSSRNATLCYPEALDPKKVAGKVVLCLRGGSGPGAARVAKSAAIKKAGGIGYILANTEALGEELNSDAYLVPGLHLGYKAATVAYTYVNNTKSATVTLDFFGTKLGVEAPRVAAFSSRGPVYATRSTLKPDIIGPGVAILAAWNGGSPTSDQDIVVDKRKSDFLLVSGTSMSCPHLSGLAAVIKSKHRDWSPAAIRSAMMTTAYANTKGTNTPIVDLSAGKPADAYAAGAGHVDVKAALTPGLVYNASFDDYIAWSCSNERLSAESVSFLANDKHYKCKTRDLASAFDLNEPSFGAFYDTNSTVTKKGKAPLLIKFKRTLTNVGEAGTYKAVLALNDAANLAKASVSPDTLTFAAKGDMQTFTVDVTMAAPPAIKNGTFLSVFGSLTWSGQTHQVRSPIALSWGDVYELDPLEKLEEAKPGSSAS